MRGVLFLLLVAVSLTVYMSIGTTVMNEVRPQVEDDPAAEEIVNTTAVHDRMDAIMFKWVPLAGFGSGLIVASFMVLRRRRIARFGP
jgi:hypothetical protein